MAGVGIENNSKLDGILTEYNAKYSDVFSRGLMTTYQHFCDDVTTDKETYEYVFYMNWPTLQAWSGNRQFKALTAQSASVTLETWEKSFEIDWVRYISDPAGMAKLIDGALAQVAAELDKLVYDKLLAATGTTGYDGTAYFSASHTVGAGTVGNYSTDSFTEAAVRAQILAMKLIKDDKAEPIGIEPNILVVGPRHMHKAKEIFNAEVRFVGLSASGVEATTSVLAATTIPNVWIGEVTVVESKRLAGASTQYHWFLFDTTKADKPIALVQHSGAPLTPTNNKDEFMGTAPHFKLGTTGVMNVSFGPWQLSYGSFATS